MYRNILPPSGISYSQSIEILQPLSLVGALAVLENGPVVNTPQNDGGVDNFVSWWFCMPHALDYLITVRVESLAHSYKLYSPESQYLYLAAST
jgi:hypothetical protein